MVTLYVDNLVLHLFSPFVSIAFPFLNPKNVLFSYCSRGVGVTWVNKIVAHIHELMSYANTDHDLS